jgi:predicted RNase H-like HicB family nuclease
MEANAVTVVYHYEDGLWWFESPDVPELSGGGNTLREAQGRATEGLAFVLERSVKVDERFDDAARAARRRAIPVQTYGVDIYSATATFAAASSESVSTAVCASSRAVRQGVATSAA